MCKTFKYFSLQDFQVYACISQVFPVKTLLQDFARKGPFFLRHCKILQDPVGSCGILQESCMNFVQESYKIPAKSCKILQGCKKKDLFL